ncbi:MAG TPA: hypothetical protein VNU68_33145 [Verrucomicrobiae bacterium]|jgi:hypothetical protein|nr:hypothetical protein [Verrucomicrobiae bacterium]
MSFITQFFIKPSKPVLRQVPSGSFTLNRNGAIMTCTLPLTFSPAHAEAIGRQVLLAFRLAEFAEMRLTELTIAYPNLKIVAREMRGGVLVFLQS